MRGYIEYHDVTPLNYVRKVHDPNWDYLPVSPLIKGRGSYC